MVLVRLFDSARFRSLSSTTHHSFDVCLYPFLQQALDPYLAKLEKSCLKKLFSLLFSLQEVHQKR